jgi:hypothetical protein
MILVFTQFYLVFFIIMSLPLQGHCDQFHTVFGRFSYVYLLAWI